MAAAEPLTVRSGRVRQARRLAVRRVRQRQRRFLAEGPLTVREALGRPDLVVEVLATESATARHDDLRAAAAAGEVRWTVVDVDVLAAVADTVTPQGVVAVCHFVDVSLADALAAAPAPRLVAVGVDVGDPGNAGTVLRCADAVGADAFVLAGESVDPYNPKAVRAGAGSLFHLPVVAGVEPAIAVAAARTAELQVIAADGAAGVDLDDAEARGLLGKPTAWLFGNEAHGLTDAGRALADELVAVPLYGRAESLNLAAAAAVCLYASARAQRRSGAVPNQPDLG